MGRTEKNLEKLQKAYDFGYETMKKNENSLRKWLNNQEKSLARS